MERLRVKPAKNDLSELPLGSAISQIALLHNFARILGVTLAEQEDEKPQEEGAMR
jgi:hypothetical protein